MVLSPLQGFPAAVQEAWTIAQAHVSCIQRVVCLHFPVSVGPWVICEGVHEEQEPAYRFAAGVGTPLPPWQLWFLLLATAPCAPCCFSHSATLLLWSVSASTSGSMYQGRGFLAVLCPGPADRYIDICCSDRPVLRSAQADLPNPSHALEAASLSIHPPSSWQPQPPTPSLEFATLYFNDPLPLSK